MPGKRKRPFEGATWEILAADAISPLNGQTVAPRYQAFSSSLATFDEGRRRHM